MAIRTAVVCLSIVIAVWVQARAVRERTVLTSFYPIYISAINVAANVPGIKVVNLTRPTAGCLHDYQLTPQEMKALTTAWIFVINGLGMESFLDNAIRQAPNLAVVNASDGVTPVMNGTIVNPHVWVGISGAIAQVKSIAAALQKLDPINAAAYGKNRDAYVAQLQALQKTAHEQLDEAPRRNIITFHEAFGYFAQEFGLHVAAVVEREPGSEPSARDLAQTILLIRKTGIKAIFAEPQYPAKSAQTIAKESGATVYILDPAVTGPLVPDAYLTIMQRNIEVLKTALQ